MQYNSAREIDLVLCNNLLRQRAQKIIESPLEIRWTP